MSSRYYLEVESLLDGVAAPNQTICRNLLAENRELFRKVPGSGHNHQAWPGGYLDHVQECMNVAMVLYWALHAQRPLPFTVGDALLVLFLHDLEKPWKYELDAEGKLQYKPEFKDNKTAQKEFREKKFREYGFVFTPEQENALKYVEGEFKDYRSDRRVMGPLAAFCHLCDVTSARIWFDNPSAESDPWRDAKRMKEK